MPANRSGSSKTTVKDKETPTAVVEDANNETAKTTEVVEEVVEQNNGQVVEEVPQTLPEQDKSNQALKDEVEKKETLDKQLKEVAVAQVQDKKVTLVKVKFIENHIFNRGIEKHTCKIGDIAEVEPHLANKFVQRRIAYILG